MQACASVFALTKGSSNNAILDRTVTAFHIICYFFRITVYFAYVDSESNYSDGISRELAQYEWCAARDVMPAPVVPATEWWKADICSICELVKRESSVWGSAVKERRWGRVKDPGDWSSP